MRNGFHTVFLYAMVNTVKQFLNLKSFPSRPRPSPPFLPLNANFCGLKFPFRANRFTRGRISALLKIPLSRAEWNPFIKNFTIRFLSISAPLPRQVPIRKKMSALRIVAARLCHSAILTRTIRLRAAPPLRTRKITPPAGNGDAAIFHGKTSISRLGFLLANTPRNSRKFPYPAQTRVNPRKTRRCGMRQRAAAIRRAAELRVRKNTGGIFARPSSEGAYAFGYRLRRPREVAVGVRRAHKADFVRVRRKINAAVGTPPEEFFVGFRGGRHRAGAIPPRLSLKKKREERRLFGRRYLPRQFFEGRFGNTGNFGKFHKGFFGLRNRPAGFGNAGGNAVPLARLREPFHALGGVR